MVFADTSSELTMLVYKVSNNETGASSAYLIVLLAFFWSCSDSRFNSGDDSTGKTGEGDSEEKKTSVVTETLKSDSVMDDSKQYIQGETDLERPLDILLVIDVSQSMASIRNGLGTRLSVLLEKIKKSDWRLAITTTNAYDCLPEKWILLKTPQGNFMRNKQDFNIIISEGKNDCGEICKVCLQDSCTEWSPEWIWNSLRHNEYPIKMAINALGGNIPHNLPSSNPTDDNCQADGTPCVYPEIPEEYQGKMICGGKRSLTKLNNDWLRPESMIAVIIVTDEDNSPHLNDEAGKPQLKLDSDVKELTNYLEETLNREKGASYEIYGILNPLANASYKEIISDKNIQSVTDENYDTLLDKISGGIWKVLNKTLDISDLASKQNFTFKGIAGMQKDHYTYQDKVITFKDTHIPPKGDKIIVNFSYTSK